MCFFFELVVKFEDSVYDGDERMESGDSFDAMVRCPLWMSVAHDGDCGG